ncbi:hypothetical protein FHR61_003005 [Xanthomonas arboricola]|uniref:Uncharacterized protein n=1 Tax=Xanthomonas cannabis TaxID=1885674 RepID=A0ABR6JL20_9XANT|nr:hypothetical protein [Xanthomonas cannabis]MBB5523142.1 hypothetical protein [Xanthomonas cannabis]
MVAAQSFQQRQAATRYSLSNKTASQLSGVVSSPIAGPCGGMDAATEPPRTDSRRVPRAVRAPRARPGVKIAKRSRDARCSRRCLIAQYWWIRQRADHLRLCCRALARPPSQDTPQVHPCSSLAASMPPRVPRRWAGKDQWSWSVRMALNQSLGKLATRCLFSSTKPPTNCLAWCPRRLRDRVAAWMPPPCLQGRTCGVSRERWGRRALDQA